MKKTIVILHGWGSLVKNWQPIKTLLEAQGYKVLLPKMPGHDGTNLERPFSTEDYTDWLKSYLKSKRLNQVILVGHSFGGQIATQFTAQNPELVTKLILINSSGIRKRLGLKRLLFLPCAKLGKWILSHPSLKKFQAPLTELLYKVARESDYLKASEVMKKTLAQVVKQDQQKNLKQIKTQTLVMWGKKDKMTPLGQGKIIHQLLTNSKFVLFEQASHGLPFQKPKAIANKILWFIS
jgi:pimeloyl-ACP methyl ester carboxylesterase